jgi:hypothetical protein
MQVQIGHAAADAAVAVALANTLFFAVPLGEARDKVTLYLVMTMAPLHRSDTASSSTIDSRIGSPRAA